MNIIIDLFVIVFLLFPSFGLAEMKVFEKEVEEIVGRDQSQEQVEAFALQKAKRLAVEEAGTYISSLTLVQNFRLVKDEITALASGVTQSQVLGVPSVVLKDGIIHVTVKARITVDTSVLDRQIEIFMRDKGALKERDEALKKMRELENQLTNLKSSEVKRLEELNTQALALERERERQRLALDEQVLKAQGEIKKAELERLQKEREMQDRISRTLAEQEKAKREEALALVAEQDRIKRAQLENEQRWNDLARKAQLTQDQWVVIDDSLSLRQAMTEVNDLKREIANLKGRLDYQYGENTRNLKAAYVQQRALTTTKLPSAPSSKDAFETTTEYNKRISAYERQVTEAEMENAEAVENLKKEENLKLAQAKEAYLGQQIRVLAPFIKRLQDLQDRKFTLPEGGTMTVALGEPDADSNRFPLLLQHNGKSWSTFWNYTDRNLARDFYRTRAYLKAEGLFQIEETAKLSPKLTAARVTHPGTKETREFGLETPRTLTEIDQFAKLKEEEATAQETSEKASRLLARKEILKSPLGGRLGKDSFLALTNSPYILEKDVVVDEGATLFIQPGVTLKFKAGTSLIVKNGGIDARGKPNRLITFTSNSSSPSPGSYPAAVRFENPSQVASFFQYCVLEFAENGLEISYGAPEIDHCLIAQNGQAGIKVTHEAAPKISFSTFARNAGTGAIVALGSARPKIYRNNFQENPFAIQSQSSIYLDARENWWGGTPPPGSLFLGDINLKPWLERPEPDAFAGRKP